MKRTRGGLSRRSVLCFGASAGLFPAIGSAAQPVKLMLSSYFHEGNVSGQGAHLFADQVSEGSAGTLRVPMEAVPAVAPLPVISLRSALAHYCAADFADEEPLLGLSAVPMLTASFAETETLLRIARPYCRAALERHGQMLLAVHPWRPAALWSTFRVRSAADLRAVLFSVASLSGQRWAWERTFVRAGVRPAYYDDAELVLSSSYSVSLKFTQEFAYFMEVFLATPLDFLTVSLRVFESLMATQRQVLVTAGQRAEFALWQFARELRDHQEVATRGVTVLAPPDDVLALLRTAAQPDIESRIQSMGTDGAAILTEYRRTVGGN